MTDPQDSSRKVLQLMTQVPGLMKSDYEDPDSAAYKEYRDGLVEQLIAVGRAVRKRNATQTELWQSKKIWLRI